MYSELLIAVIYQNAACFEDSCTINFQSLGIKTFITSLCKSQK